MKGGLCVKDPVFKTIRPLFLEGVGVGSLIVLEIFLATLTRTVLVAMSQRLQSQVNLKETVTIEAFFTNCIFFQHI